MPRQFIALGAVVLLAGCVGQESSVEPAPSATGDDKLEVYVVNYPLHYFAERIGGEMVEVRFSAPPEIDPAFWSPDVDAVAAYQRADLILLNGADYAKWVEKVTLPASKIVDTSGAFQDRYIVIENTVSHSHGPGGEHSHGETAFTTWLDLTLAIEHAKGIRDVFAKARPDGEEAFQEGFASLERDLLGLDESLRRLTSGKTQPLLGSHPVYQYLARRYGLDLKSVHFEPDQVPDEKTWHELEHLLEGHAAKWMLWEGAPVEETAAKLVGIGVESIVFDPCGNKPKEGDFLAVMKTNLSNLKKVYDGPDS